MAGLKTKTLVSVDSEWKDYKDVYEGKVTMLRAAKCKLHDERGDDDYVVLVGTDRIAKALVPGSAYVGNVFQPEGSQFWHMKLLAKNNPSLQKEGGQYGGHAPSGQPASPAQQPGPVRSSPTGTASGGGSDCGTSNEWQAITCAASIAVAEMRAGTSGKVDMERLAELAVSLYAVQDRLEGLAQPANKSPADTGPASKMNDTMREKLLVTINQAIKDAGLWERFGASEFADDRLINLWVESSANPVQFGIKLNGLLPQYGAAPAGASEPGPDGQEPGGKGGANLLPF